MNTFLRSLRSPLLAIGLGLSALLGACSSSGNAADRLARLEQSIAAVEGEAVKHEDETSQLSALSALVDVEALHRDRLKTIAAALAEEGQDLDACGYGSCCGGALADLETQRALLLSGIDSHHTATSSLATLGELFAAETTHREETDLITMTLRGHHDTMATASMCCHCRGMRDGQ